MNCELAEQVVSKALDGEASPAELRELDEHCASCERCNAYRARQVELDRTLGAALGHCIESLRPRVHNRTRPWRTIARIAAVLVLMFGCGLAGYSLPRKPAPPQPGPGGKAEPANAPAANHEFRVMTAEIEHDPVWEILWDAERGLRTISRIDTEKIRRVVSADGRIAIDRRTTDSQYKLVGFKDSSEQ